MFKLELQTQKKSDMKQKVKWAVKTLNKDRKRSFSWCYFGNEKNVGYFLLFEATFPWRS